MADTKIPVTIDIDLEDLIPGFLANRNKDLDSLKQSLERQDFRAIQSLGHSLKGVGGGYGFERISELGSDIESAARDADPDRLKELIDAFADFLNRVEVRFE